MPYKVVPFRGNVGVEQGATRAAQQLQELIDEHANGGWDYHRLETFKTDVTTPGTPGDNGCLGFGATPPVPPSKNTVDVYVAVFSRDE